MTFSVSGHAQMKAMIHLLLILIPSMIELSSKTSVNFFDTTVYLENGKIWIDMYCKETDSHNYLHYDTL